MPPKNPRSRATGPITGSKLSFSKSGALLCAPDATFGKCQRHFWKMLSEERFSARRPSGGPPGGKGAPERAALRGHRRPRQAPGAPGPPREGPRRVFLYINRHENSGRRPKAACLLPKWCAGNELSVISVYTETSRNVCKGYLFL
jgi:hypothetical protein